MAKTPAPEDKKKLKKKLTNKYRLVVMNEDTFEEKASFTLSRLNVITFVGSLGLFLIVITTYLIAFTPLREYIPGYADVETKKEVRRLVAKADSLEGELRSKAFYIENIKNIIEGKGLIEEYKQDVDPAKDYKNIQFKHSPEDSALRAQVAQEDQFNIVKSELAASSGISSFSFFTPLKGEVTSRFDLSDKHYGTDIVTARNEPIKATLDGVVVFASWTNDTGYVIALQHSNNIVSLYKHNSVLLKKVGNTVKAGEVIAIVGNSGELTTGPHLHFELWYQGKPINPEDYIVF